MIGLKKYKFVKIISTRGPLVYVYAFKGTLSNEGVWKGDPSEYQTRWSSTSTNVYPNDTVDILVRVLRHSIRKSMPTAFAISLAHFW